VRFARLEDGSAGARSTLTLVHSDPDLRNRLIDIVLDFRLKPTLKQRLELIRPEARVRRVFLLREGLVFVRIFRRNARSERTEA
jgi:hypothetical protein